MLYSPLFRVGDCVTMRSDLERHAPVHFLFGDDAINDADLCVLQCDIDKGGMRSTVENALDVTDGHYPTCNFLPDGASGYQFIDETMVEAYRVMRHLNIGV